MDKFFMSSGDFIWESNVFGSSANYLTKKKTAPGYKTKAAVSIGTIIKVVSPKTQERTLLALMPVPSKLLLSLMGSNLLLLSFSSAGHNGTPY
ncbi:MAG: hypothetical protein J5798_08425 [Spirochaetaceae bacterium]|nr:hypothetical protein [Spirochaetaceae bacterium]MBO4728319.1 hypothetical protein [Spirochaetaceae bacterium]